MRIMKQFQISAAFKTDTGLVREQNEDAVLLFEPEDALLLESKGVLAVVADGVGGNVGGEVASSIAVETVKNYYYTDRDADRVSNSLERAVKAANKRIIDAANKEPDYNGMATTCTALVLCGGEAVVAHVGDSRAYKLRGNEPIRLTRDHTLVNDLVENGTISEEQARSHPQKNIITRALGSQPDIDVDIVEMATGVDDCYLLCSDGLSNLITEKEMAEITSSSDPSASCEKMVELARGRGGYDNITVQVLKVSPNKPERSKSENQAAVIRPGSSMSQRDVLNYLFVAVGVLAIIVSFFWFTGASSGLFVLSK
jgi:serine/threonine protein phosphatase PrpC